MKIIEHGDFFKTSVPKTKETFCPECGTQATVKYRTTKSYTFFGKEKFTASFNHTCTECKCSWTDKDIFYGRRERKKVIDNINIITIILGITGMVVSMYLPVIFDKCGVESPLAAAGLVAGVSLIITIFSLLIRGILDEK